MHDYFFLLRKGSVDTGFLDIGGRGAGGDPCASSSRWASASLGARRLRVKAQFKEVRALGIDFVGLHEGMYTSTPNGHRVFGIFAGIAESERS